ncbi:MAG TPA: bifunctional DNA-formamidopyrimidine glycosylase/DNA-(apurinic or apyrimidinic site) lyase [Acidobacteriota bacterium]
MPELPEVETIVRQLRRQVLGRTIAALRLSWPRSVEGSQEEFRRRVRGLTIAAVSRRGKYIGVEGEDGTFFTVHLRMTGKLVGKLAAGDRKHLRVQFTFNDGSALHFVDARKFGRVRLWPCRGESCPGLGPEPLRAQAVLAALRGLSTRRPIKAVLLDQTVLAGIGNIYADESLFASGIHPLIPAAALDPEQQKRLASAVPRILKLAIRRRGTTLRNYRTVADESGENQEYLNVYGRAGKPCLVCGTPIEKIRISGRSSHFCPRCQTKPALGHVHC